MGKTIYDVTRPLKGMGGRMKGMVPGNTSYKISDVFDNPDPTAHYTIRLARNRKISNLMKDVLEDPLIEGKTFKKRQSYKPGRELEMEFAQMLFVALLNTFEQRDGCLQFTSMPAYIDKYCRDEQLNIDSLLFRLAKRVLARNAKPPTGMKLLSFHFIWV